MTLKKHSLTSDHIASRIKSVEYRKVGLKTTVCLITLVNGFEIVATSGCVDPDNYDPEIGRRIARENAVKKIWELEGYLLQQRINDQGRADQVMTLDYQAIAKGIIQTTNIMDTMCHPDRNQWERVSDQDPVAVDHIAGTIKKGIHKQLQTVDHADH